MNEEIYWIWLSRIRDLGYIKFVKLLTYFKNLQNIWNANDEELIKVDGIDENIINNMIEEKSISNLTKIKEYMNKYHIKLINIYDAEYPDKLKNIYSPPIVIYVQGNIDLLNEKSIAMIGCRNCTSYGKNVALKLSYDIAKRDITVISGLAKGIDALSHIGALNAKGKTIAVLGTPHSNIYPKENYMLYTKILQNKGAVISEYSPFSKTEKSDFAKRNRIISGLSDGVLVVEAREKSGTMITVDFALDQGKNVYAVPGNINSITSIGTNKLIKEGAIPVTDEKDIE